MIDNKYFLLVQKYLLYTLELYKAGFMYLIVGIFGILLAPIFTFFNNMEDLND